MGRASRWFHVYRWQQVIKPRVPGFSAVGVPALDEGDPEVGYSEGEGKDGCDFDK